MSSASYENDVETGESLPSDRQDGTIPDNMSCTRDKNDVEVVESMARMRSRNFSSTSA